MNLNIAQQKLLTGHRASVYALDIIDNGSLLSAGGDGWIVEWPLHEGEDGTLLSKVESQIFAMAYHASKDQIWAGDMNGGVYVISRKEKKLLSSRMQHKKGTYIITSLQDKVLTAGSDGAFTIWSDKDLLPVHTFKLSNDRLRAIALHPLEPLMAIAGAERKIYILDTDKWQWIQTIDDAHEGTIFDLSFHPEGDILISGGMDAHIKTWNWRNSELLNDIPAHNFTVNSIHINVQKGILATGSRDNSIKLWDLFSLDILKVLDQSKAHHHLNSVNALSWSKDGELLISAGDDRTIRVWNVENGR